MAMLDENDKAWIQQTMAALVHGIVQEKQARRHPPLTVPEFAAAVGLNPEVVRRKIRTGEIPPKMVFGSRPKKISVQALELFGVDPAGAYPAQSTPPSKA